MSYGMGFRGMGEHPQIKAAKLEMEGVTEMFNRMTDLCFNKCMGKAYKDGELNVGEMSCTDRCVSKYMAAHRKVGEELQAFQQQEQERMQAQGLIPPQQ